MNLKSLLLLACLTGSAFAGKTPALFNPLVDFPGHKRAVVAVEKLRPTRLVSEAEFLRLAAEPGTVIVDARSARMFERLHVRGAINLSFPDFTAETLASAIPTKSTRVLIYCNNNFKDAPGAFPSKNLDVALNLSTYVALHAYGYDNVYELAPLLEVKTTKLPLAGGAAN